MSETMNNRTLPALLFRYWHHIVFAAVALLIIGITEFMVYSYARSVGQPDLSTSGISAEYDHPIVTYTIRIANTGDYGAAVYLSTTLPYGLEYVSGTLAYTHPFSATFSDNTLTAHTPDFPTVVPGGSLSLSNVATITFAAQARTIGTFTTTLDLRDQNRSYAIEPAVIQARGMAVYLPLVLKGIGPPGASFVGKPRTGYPPLTVVFTDTTTGSVDTWLWDFGDGKQSTETNPAHTYTTQGSYTVTLTVANVYGTDREISPNYISVRSLEPTWVTATFDGWYSLAQYGDTVTVTNQGDGGFTLDWFGADVMYMTGASGPSRAALAGLARPLKDTRESRIVYIFSMPPDAPRGDVLSGTITFPNAWTTFFGKIPTPGFTLPVAKFAQTNWVTYTSGMDIRSLWFGIALQGWPQAIPTSQSVCNALQMPIPPDTVKVRGDKVGLMVYTSAIERPDLWVPDYSTYTQYYHSFNWPTSCQPDSTVIRLLIQPTGGGAR